MIVYAWELIALPFGGALVGFGIGIVFGRITK